MTPAPEKAAPIPAVELTPLQLRALGILSTSPMGQNGADMIAHYLGYRPARKGRLAVSRALRSLLGEQGSAGKYVLRIPPRDQWDHATWCITTEGRARLRGDAS